jgi:hypothetical protein
LIEIISFSQLELSEDPRELQAEHLKSTSPTETFQMIDSKSAQVLRPFQIRVTLRKIDVLLLASDDF